ncbi:MAG: hypothetical protein B6D46_14870 [Polyangiaceae bacterium UTPRO1]|jgi:RNA polymerase sigma factor for flagellar operon FliA|nr:FliA/WhiG family RNA polymerase sigma factor [Myxococcales bacterium]OQY65002.1 MAG: hypothetical protein B6D46_14870 [Polyangiaceae bacterium UTPRO1]
MEAALNLGSQRTGGTDHALAASADAILRRHLPLVRDVAHRIACRKPPHVEIDELMSWGMEGLLDAYRRFRPDKHASFRTYARFRVRGVIMDNLRERDLLSRTARRKAVLLERTRATLEARLGRVPGEDEIAAALKIDLAKLRSMSNEAGFGTTSLEDLGHPGDRVSEIDRHLPDHAADPLRAILGRERARLVNAAIDRLPEKECAAVTLYYKSDRTMREVADSLGLSESRVSQLHSQALGRLRTLLADYLLRTD